MKAARLSAPQTIEFFEMNAPKPAEGEILLKVQAVSVCGSDTHMFYDQVLPEEMYPSRPGAPCHEIAGTIVESRSDKFKVGQRAVVLSSFRNPDALGGLVEYINIPENMVMPVPDDRGIDEWLMCQPMGTVLFATKLWGPTAGLRIGVVGQGAIGLSFTNLAAAQGAAQVIGIDLLDYRLKKSLEMGATHTINPDNVDPIEAIAELTDGHGLDVVVDASGDPEGLNHAISYVNQYGKVLGFSLISMDSVIPFKHMAWMGKVATLIPCSSISSPDPTGDINEVIALMDKGWIDPAKLITHNVDFDAAPEAYEMYSKQQDGDIKVVMEVNAGN
jgi:2-desacetyl-2-hydroxyethyl bacteriochlorophyllide A dehydrogenase